MILCFVAVFFFFFLSLSQVYLTRQCFKWIMQNATNLQLVNRTFFFSLKFRSIKKIFIYKHLCFRPKWSKTLCLSLARCACELVAKALCYYKYLFQNQPRLDIIDLRCQEEKKNLFAWFLEHQFLNYNFMEYLSLLGNSNIQIKRKACFICVDYLMIKTAKSRISFRYSP